MASSLESRCYKNRRIIFYPKFNQVNMPIWTQHQFSNPRFRKLSLGIDSYIDAHSKMAKLPFDEAT